MKNNFQKIACLSLIATLLHAPYVQSADPVGAAPATAKHTGIPFSGKQTAIMEGHNGAYFLDCLGESRIQGCVTYKYVMGPTSVVNVKVSDKQIMDFLAMLKKAVEERDAETFANYVRFPIGSIQLRGQKLRTLLEREEFTKNFDQIITEDVEKALYEAAIGNINVTPKGIILNGGTLWFFPSTQAEGKIEVISINN